MINLFLNGGQIPDENKEIPLIEHQVFWSKILLFMALICPPWMLFVKPLLLRRDHEQKMIKREKQGGDFEMVESSSDRSRSPNPIEEDYNKIELTPLSHEINSSKERNTERHNAFDKVER